MHTYKFTFPPLPEGTKRIRSSAKIRFPFPLTSPLPRTIRLRLVQLACEYLPVAGFKPKSVSCSKKNSDDSAPQVWAEKFKTSFRGSDPGVLKMQLCTYF